jgi:hypothetical protein
VEEKNSLLLESESELEEFQSKVQEKRLELAGLEIRIELFDENVAKTDSSLDREQESYKLIQMAIDA